MKRKPRSDVLAEDIFRGLCSKADVTRNRAEDDQAGWDYFVEFAPSRAEIPADLRPAPHRCKVQVKSSINRRANSTIKLSNALRFAEEGLPCFIVHVAFTTPACTSWTIYVRHFWTPMMAQALREARARSVAGLPLHSKRLAVTMTRGEAVADDDVLDALLRQMSDIGGDYAGQKRELARGLGYENGSGTGEFVLARSDFSELTKLHLGLVDEVPIESFTYTDRRFNIPAPPVRHGPGKISITPTTAPCVATLRRPGSSDEVSWPGTVFSALFDHLPPEERCARVQAGPLSLTIHVDGRAKFAVEMDFGEKVGPAELSRRLSFRSWEPSTTHEITIFNEGRALDVGPIRYERPPKDTERWARARNAFSTLMRVVPAERLPAEFCLSLNEVWRATEGLEQFAGMIDAAGSIKATLGGIPPEAFEGLRTLIIPFAVSIGGFQFIAVTEREVDSLAVANDEMVANTRSVRLLRGTVIKSGAAERFDVMAREVNWARERNRTIPGKHLVWRPDNVTETGAWSGEIEINSDDEDETS